MESRVIKLEARVEYVRRELDDLCKGLQAQRAEARLNFKMLLAAWLIASLGLAGLMAKGFGWL